MTKFFWLSKITTFISIPVAIFACIRYRKVDRIYLPFVWYLIVSGINETYAYYAVHVLRNNAVNSNIYRLVEFILLILFMKNLGGFKRKSKWFIAILVAVISAWIYEYLIEKKIATFNGYIGVYASFFLSLTAVYLLNIQLTSFRGRLFTNPVFIICIAIILFFSMEILTELFYVYLSSQGIEALPRAIFRIFQCVNIVYVSLMAIALSKMHKRTEFSLTI